jgi:tetratricopeptide (TPR) repeat protein
VLKVEKTVFISYRRTNIGFALAVYQNLTQQGYDVFLDYTGIDSGNFEQIIIENIKSRAHFIVILTLSALERVHEPNDWLRREIETAIDLKRNIVPLTFENFDWKQARENYLTGKLTVLSGYNELPVPIPYFSEAMDRLHHRYLNIALDLVLHPVSTNVEQATEAKQVETNAQLVVSISELTAEEWFERGNAKWEQGDYQGAIIDCTEAIRLKPDYAEAYMRRGTVYSTLEKYADALHDFNKSISFKSDYAYAYNNRGVTKYKTGDKTGAFADYSVAIHLQPDYATAYYNRGALNYNMGNKTAAIIDYDEAIRLKPDYIRAYTKRGTLKANMGDNSGAIADYTEAIRLNPNDANSYNHRGDVKFKQKNYEAAIRDFEAALRLQPNHPLARCNFELAQEKLNEEK